MHIFIRILYFWVSLGFELKDKEEPKSSRCPRTGLSLLALRSTLRELNMCLIIT